MYKEVVSFQDLIDSVILKEVSKKRPLMVVHGGRALNTLLPVELYRPTTDWDIYTKRPKIANRRMDRKLDKAFGYDLFYVTEGKYYLHDGRLIYSVVNRYTGKKVCDFAKFPPRKKGEKATYIIIGKIYYETLDDAKIFYKRILEIPKFEIRWDKTRFDLERINTFKKKLKNAKRYNWR